MRHAILLVSIAHLLSCAWPGSARAQSASRRWEVRPAPVQVHGRVVRDASGEPLELEAERDRSFESTYLLTLGAGMTVGAVAGLCVIGTELPSYAGQWRGEGIAGLSASVLFSAMGPLFFGAGLALGAGDDPREGIAIAAILQYVSAAILGISAIIIAPGVGDDWEDTSLQADTAMVLGVESLGLGMGAMLGAVVLILMEEPPDAMPLVAPSVTPEGATITVTGRF